MGGGGWRDGCVRRDWAVFGAIGSAVGVVVEEGIGIVIITGVVFEEVAAGVDVTAVVGGDDLRLILRRGSSPDIVVK